MKQALDHWKYFPWFSLQKKSSFLCFTYVKMEYLLKIAVKPTIGEEWRGAFLKISFKWFE